MKILILNYEFPPLGGGAGNTTRYISRELARSGHSVTVITTWFKGLEEKSETEGYNLIRLRTLRKRADRSNTLEMFHYVLKASFRSAKFVNEERPDHVISFFAMPTGLVAWYLFKRFKVPYSLSLQGGDVPGFLPKNLRRLHRLTMPLTNMVWRSASNIVANSDGLKELAEKTASPLGKKVECIPNGIDTDIFKPAPSPASSKDLSQTFSIIFVGRLVEQKGVTYILQALKEIQFTEPAAFEKMQCAIIGDGPLRHSLESEARSLKVDKRISFLGWLDRNELPSRYASSSIFMMPSFEEGMPNTVLEAMASGLPIIATNNRGTNELVQDGVNGIVVNRHDELAAAILRLYHDPLKRKEYGANSRKSTMTRGWDVLAQSYLDLINS